MRSASFALVDMARLVTALMLAFLNWSLVFPPSMLPQQHAHHRGRLVALIATGLR
jgi:hypothetical protein